VIFSSLFLYYIIVVHVPHIKGTHVNFGVLLSYDCFVLFTIIVVFWSTKNNIMI
jgi:hypothetical protein